jgi:hypothetical protein
VIVPAPVQSPSIFWRDPGATRKGGRLCVRPGDDGFRCKQHYWPNTNVVITRFLHRDGIRATSSARFVATLVDVTRLIIHFTVALFALGGTLL